MSMIPTRQIEGDVAVGRNVAAGGDATVRGSAVVGHNLRVEGWLDAPNIRGASKGLFSSLERLNAAYPNPREGWWALVGETVPAQVFIAEGGVWVGRRNADGTPVTGGTATLEVREFGERLSTLEQDIAAEERSRIATDTKLQVEVENVRREARAAQSAADKAQENADTGIRNAARAQAAAAAAQQTADEAVRATDELDGKITDLREDTGILLFDKVVYRVSEAEALAEGSVVYERAEGVFRRRTATGWELAPGYNVEGYLDGRSVTYPRLDKVFRCGGTLYRCRIDNFVPGLLAFAVDKDVEALSDRVTSAEYRLEEVENSTEKNASAIARQREEAGVYRFDGVFEDVGDVPEADLRQGMVVWEGLSGIFRTLVDADGNEWEFASEDFTQENPNSHDNADVTIPRTDRLFRCGNQLYHVAGSPEEGFRLVRYALVEEVETIEKQLDTVRESTVDNYQAIKLEQQRREANCDALSDRISAGLSGVGIYPFAGFEDFGLGAGTDEEGEYAPGSVVFSTQTRCFLLKGADGSWQHAGAPYDVVDGGHFVPHTDCLYRLGQYLYRAAYSGSDGWCLVRHLDEQDKLTLHPRMTFSDDFNYTGTRLAMAEVTERDIEEWRAWSTVDGVVYGDYDRTTRRWSLNGITDIDQDEHDMIMMLAPACRDNSLNTAIHTLGGRIIYKNLSSTGLVRTLMPIIYNSAGGQTGSLSYDYFCNIEVLRFGENGFTSAGIKNCTKLREIYGLRLQRNASGRTAIKNCPALVTFFGKGLNYDLDLSECPKLSMESVLYIINNRGGTGVITLILHADVYAALTDEVIDAALKKNVSLAQA